MRKGINLLLALTILFGLSSANLATAEDSSASGAKSGSSSAPAATKPKKERKLGKRLKNLKDRFHKKKAPAASTTPAPQK